MIRYSLSKCFIWQASVTNGALYLERKNRLPLGMRRCIYSLTGVWKDLLTPEQKHDVEKYWKDKLVEIDSHRKLQVANGEKMYVLSMFPYPSGKLHMGHVRIYTVSDAIARFHRFLGKNVIHPIGWDAFGLPAENAARERGEIPDKWTASNISHMKEQLQQLGCSFDWEKEIATCDPEYYRWTQYIFRKMFDDGLAYQKQAMVNWDPVDQTVLANEQVDEKGCSWRSGAKVQKKLLKQWFIRTTKFSKALHDSLEESDLDGWKDILKMQQNWIGDCNGWRMDFELELAGKKCDDWISTWTAFPELIYGASFIAVKPEHYLTYSGDSSGKQSEDSGVDRILDVVAIHPFTGRRMPVIVTTRAPYSPEAICHIGIPCHNEADRALASCFDLPIIEVLQQSSTVLTNSEQFSGMESMQARKSICDHALKRGFGGYATSNRLHDWLISRQRYWGTPIPIIHCPKCKAVPVPYEDLPVVLPKITETFDVKGVSPLEQMTDWLNVKCPKCGSSAKRETDTMDTFVDSSWYFLRYLDPSNRSEPFASDVASKFMPVDLYIGGKEHALLHLYSARIFNHYLHSLGLVPCREPFQRLLMMGVVKGQTFRVKKSGHYVRKADVETKKGKIVEKCTGLPVVAEWTKMSKSKHNGVDPEGIFAEHGVDAARLLILSGTPPTEEYNWSPAGFAQLSKWQNKVWLCIWEFLQPKGKISEATKAKIKEHDNFLFENRNACVKKITELLLEKCNFCEAIDNLKNLTNSLRKVPRDLIGHSEEYEKTLCALLVMLAPFAPHFTSELWAGFAHSPKLTIKMPPTVWEQPWPEVDMKFPLRLIVKVDGNQVDTINIPRSILDVLEKESAIKMAENILSGMSTNGALADVLYAQRPGSDAVLEFLCKKTSDLSEEQSIVDNK